MQWLELSAWDAGVWIDKSQAKPQIVVVVDAESVRGAVLLKSLENSGAFTPLLPQPDGLVAVSGLASRANADMIRLVSQGTTIETAEIDVAYPNDPALRRATTHADVLLNAMPATALYLRNIQALEDSATQPDDAIESEQNSLGLVLPAQPDAQADVLALLRRAGVGVDAEVRKVPTRTLAVRGVSLQSLPFDPKEEGDPDSETVPALFLVVQPGRATTPAKLDRLQATLDAVESAITEGDANNLDAVAEKLTNIAGPLPGLENLLRNMVVSEVEQVLAGDVEPGLAGDVEQMLAEDVEHGLADDVDDVDALTAALTDDASVPDDESSEDPIDAVPQDQEPPADPADAELAAAELAATDAPNATVPSPARRRKPATSNERKPATSNERKPATSNAEPREKGDHLDFGEYIPRARKERYTGINVASILEMNQDGLREFVAGQSVREVTKAAIWPRPSAVADKAAGLTPLLHLALVECWKILNGKPRTSLSKRRRVTHVGSTLEQIRGFMLGVARFRDFCLAATTFDDLVKRFEQVSNLEKDENAAFKDAARLEAEKNYENAKAQGRPTYRWGSFIYQQSELAQRILFLGAADATADPLLGVEILTKAEGLSARTIVDLVCQKSSWRFNVNTDIINAIRHLKVENPDPDWDAILPKSKERSLGKAKLEQDGLNPGDGDYIDANGQVDEAGKSISKTAAREQDVATRSGLNEYRSGTDILETALLDQLGLRGGQYGNWVNQRDRAAFLNLSYDSLRDLAEIGGYPLRAIGFDDRLGAAWGARGRGGSAAAHYEPGLKVINLTKPSGAGALAHEWAHAFDHFLFDTLIPPENRSKTVQPFLSEVLAAHPNRADFKPICPAFDRDAHYEKSTLRLGDRLKSTNPEHVKAAEVDREFWVKNAELDYLAQDRRQILRLNQLLGYPDDQAGDGSAPHQATAAPDEVTQDVYRAAMRAMAGFTYALDNTDLSSFDNPAVALFEQKFIIKEDLLDRYFKNVFIGNAMLPCQLLVEAFRKHVTDTGVSWIKLSPDIEAIARDSLYDAWRGLFAETRIGPDIATGDNAGLLGYPVFMLYGSKIQGSSFRFGENPKPYKDALDKALLTAVVDRGRDLLVQRLIDRYKIEDPTIPADASFNDILLVLTESNHKTFVSNTKYLVENLANYADRRFGYMSPHNYPGAFAPGTLRGTTVRSRMALNCDVLKNRRAYYASPVEKFARSFESCVKRALSEQGSANTYLVAGRKEGGVYPEGAQLDELMVQFKNLNKATAALARHLGMEDRELPLLMTAKENTAEDTVNPVRRRKRLTAA